MRLFLVLCSLAALAYGKPQGYQYGYGIPNALSVMPNFGAAGTSTNFLVAPGQQQSGGAGFSKFQAGGLSSTGGIGGGVGFAGTQPSSTSLFSQFAHHSQYQQQTQQQQHHMGTFAAPLVHKQFITVAAPEDIDNLERTKHLVIGRPQKNYRVVFIKAPSSSNANVKLSAEYAPQEEKTVIYVLSKKDSTLEVNDIATPAPTVASKPEVFFIKYKTDEEAQHAQHQIQAEYDKIEGTSEITDAGVAPQQSVVGILDNNAGGVGSASTLGGAKSPTYLPPGNSQL